MISALEAVEDFFSPKDFSKGKVFEWVVDVSRVGPPCGSDTNPPTVLRVTYARPNNTMPCGVSSEHNSVKFSI